MDKAQKEVDLLAKKLELYYMKLLKKYNYRIFGFSCKTKKTEIDSSEKIGLKDCMYVFKTESTIRKKDIVSKYFVLKNMKHQYVKNLYIEDIKSMLNFLLEQYEKQNTITANK